MLNILLGWGEAKPFIYSHSKAEKVQCVQLAPSTLTFPLVVFDAEIPC